MHPVSPAVRVVIPGSELKSLGTLQPAGHLRDFSSESVMMSFVAFGSRWAWISVSALSHISCVTLGKLVTSTSLGFLTGKMEIMQR